MNIVLKMAILERAGNQTQFAREVSIGESTLSRIINGWKVPTPEQKEAIAQKLGLPKESLFPGER